MHNPVSISNLLTLLDKANVEVSVYNQCIIADRLCRQHEFQQSIRIARDAIINAVRIDTQKKASTTGVAFLFLAASRHASNIKVERDAALWDADAAIRWLIMDRRNGLLARLIKARIAQEDHRRLVAIESYAEAGLLLEALIKDCHKRGDQSGESKYIELKRTTDEIVKRMELGTLQEGPYSADIPTSVGSKTALPNPNAHGDRFIQLLSQLNLVWPGDKIPVLQITMGNSDTVNGVIVHKTQPLKSTIDFSNVRYVSIESRVYLIKAIDVKSRQSFRMYAGQTYLSLEIAGNPIVDQASVTYLIVRRQRRIITTKPLVVADAGDRRIWIENTEPYIIGGDDGGVSPNGISESIHSGRSSQVIGTVEAMLLRESIAKA
jgi:hypothetical protein